MNPETLRAAVNENKDRVFNHALYLLRSQEDAEDATQEVFIRLWKHRNRIAEGSTVSWIMRTTHNLCLDFIRRRRTSSVRLRRRIGTNMDSLAADRDRHTDPEEHYDFTRKQKELASAMEGLSPRTHSMLLLHYFHGFKYEAIAEILDTNAGTVKVTVHRGRKELKEILSQSRGITTSERKHENAM